MPRCSHSDTSSTALWSRTSNKNTQENTCPDTLDVRYIYLDLGIVSGVNVGKYTNAPLNEPGIGV